MPKHDSKPPRKDQNHKARRGGSTFLGILIGLVLGLVIALGVAWYINKLPNPFREKSTPATPQKEAPAPKAAAPAAPVKEASPAPKATEAAPKVSAQEMLTKGETPAAAPEKTSTPPAKETFFLQTGSFQNAPEADNLKARLALLGLEASIQTRTLPEKGVWHRVRIGPYTDVEELNRVRAILKQNDIDAALVKVRDTDK